jgi:hypothetical protein
MHSHLTSTVRRQSPARTRSIQRRAVLAAVALALAPAGLACGGDDDGGGLASASEAEPEVARLEVTAKEDASGPGGIHYEFDMPEEVPAGAARLSLSNGGDEEHHAQLFRLKDGATPDQLMAALATGNPAAALEFGAFEGGTGLVAPRTDSQADAVIELAPGTYVLLCLVPDQAGAPHLAHGMLRAFDVTESTEVPAAPAADLDVELVDYAFDLPDSLAGDALLAITNAGSEPHEMTVLRLDDGASADEVVEALQQHAPPPGTPVGGMQALLPGAAQQLQLDLEPGEYVVICHVPSPDGTPHHARGMIRQVTVT